MSPRWVQIWEAVMPWAMTSFEVKLSVVPGWKCRGHTIADCFVLSENGDTVEDMAAKLIAALW
jgi:hypothetical protein